MGLGDVIGLLVSGEGKAKNLGKALLGIGLKIGGALLGGGGGLLSSLLGGISSFASGGIVTGPQLALVGDNPGRKEAIIPSEMFGQIGGGGNLEARISGNDLLILLNRANNSRNRNQGL